MQLMTPQMTPVIKKLIIANMVIWVVGVLIFQNFFLDQPYLFQWFGFTPYRVISDFFIWQPLTYLFLHSSNVFHVVLNMLILWWFGGELEQRWGEAETSYTRALERDQGYLPHLFGRSQVYLKRAEFGKERGGLFGSTYGRILLLKVGLVGVAAGLGASR